MERLKGVIVMGLSSVFLQVLDAKITEKLAANPNTAKLFSGYGRLILPGVWLVVAIFLLKKMKGLLGEAVMGIAIGAFSEITSIILSMVGSKSEESIESTPESA